MTNARKTRAKRAPVKRAPVPPARPARQPVPEVRISVKGKLVQQGFAMYVDPATGEERWAVIGIDPWSMPLRLQTVAGNIARALQSQATGQVEGQSG